MRTIKLTDDGLYGVAIYLGKSFLNGKLKRKWNCSHNCIHPNIEINYNEISSKSLSKIQNAKSEAELIRIIEKQYKGWHVVLGNPVKSSNEVTGSQNLRVKLMRNIPKKDIYEERELNMMPIFDSRKDVY